MKKVLSEINSQGIRVKVECDKPMGKAFVQDVVKAGDLLKKHEFDCIRFEPIE